MDRHGLLQGKVAVITGAGSGVGRASARTFAREGAQVVCGDLREAWVADTVDLVERDGGTARAVQCDVTREADVKQAIAEATARFGRVDVVFNNAGISTPGLTIGDHDDARYDQLMDVNLRGVFYGCKHAVAAFTEQGGGGSIINTSSVSGLVGFGGIVYGITKGGHQPAHQGTRRRSRAAADPGECDLPGPDAHEPHARRRRCLPGADLRKSSNATAR